jgi:transposase InsO family protein
LFEEIQQAAAKGQAVNALCQMTGLNRAGFYRWRLPRQPLPVEMEIRDEMQRIALEFPAYGYRRITAELQHRGFDINHKRVLRMMHQDNLLCVRRRAFVVTTDSRHNLPVYPNLARALCGPRRSTNCGSPISPTSGCAPSSCISPWSWTHSPGA